MYAMGNSQNSKGATPPPSDSVELIDKFLDAIWMERGLSANTLGAYRADLMTLWRGLSERDIALEEAQKADLLEFIAKRVESGAKPRSTARQLSYPTKPASATIIEFSGRIPNIFSMCARSLESTGPVFQAQGSPSPTCQNSVSQI